VIFVIRHDRPSQVTEWIREFDDSMMEEAQKLRLQAEREALKSGESPEIVVLSADSKSALERTHSRYFPREVFEKQLQQAAKKR
jgi:hypothetical protein